VLSTDLECLAAALTPRPAVGPLVAPAPPPLPLVAAILASLADDARALESQPVARVER